MTPADWNDAFKTPIQPVSVMRTSRVRWVALVLSGALAGCAPAVAPVATPAPPPAAAPIPSPLPVAKGQPPIPPAAASIDAATLAIDRAELEFNAGRADFDQGRLVAAREHFDRAIDMLLMQDVGTAANPRLRAALTRLVDRISALDLVALRDADGVTEASSKPAAIDQVLSAADADAPDPTATTAETVAADLERLPRDVPIALNPKVLGYVELFKGRLRDFMQQGLDRGQRYLPMIQTIFREEGVPLDLAYVPLVESAFVPNALSRARARGIWQFMDYTGKEYGLKIDWFIDERSDPEKATRAAAQYLKTLGAQFNGDWAFALASYNAGPGRLQSAATRSKSDDFWAIASSSRYLPRETREYVPMIMAAIIVGKNPTLYGFQVAPAAPESYETVSIPGALDLKIIAEWADVPVGHLQSLNPDLRRTTTPNRSHTLKVPIGTAGMIERGLATAGSLYRTFTFHTVRRGDTLGTIARKYGVSQTAIRQANAMGTSTRLSIGQALAIPAPSASGLPASPNARSTTAQASSTAKSAPSARTPASAAAKPQATPAARPQTTSAKPQATSVAKSQTTAAARPSATTSAQPKAAVTSKAAAAATSGRQPASTASGTTDFYRVRPGDTLFSIARQFATTVTLLKQWNGLATNSIRVGDRIRVRG